MSSSDAGTEVAEHHVCPIIDERRAIQRIGPRQSDVGGMPVARVLPRPERRLIGAWCFLDHAGPAYLGTGRSSLPIRTAGAERALLIGGQPFADEVNQLWNFVGHGKAEIERAQADWEAHSQRFGEVREFEGPRLSPPPIPWAQAGADGAQ